MKKEFVKELDNIFILGRGQSLIYCPMKKPEKTEYWGCNNTYRERELDRLFIMHDVHVTQFNREKNLIKDINEKEFPVYTLGQYKELKDNIVYPMERVIAEFNTAYFLNNISYMLALAIMQKPKNLVLYGVDMSFGTGVEYMRNEKGCVEFWIGVATGRNITYTKTKGSTLMQRRGRSNFYGMIAKVDNESKTLNLNPEYMWGKEKCASKYKIVKVSHNL